MSPRPAPIVTIRWLVAPAAECSSRSSAVSVSSLRILAGLLWLYNVSWKRPPDFGEDSGNGLYGFTRDAVDHPVFPPYSWIVEQVVLPNFTAFGWLVLVVETALAVLLLAGAFVRMAALLGIGQSLAIGLSVAQTPGEWPWSYWMMIGIHVVLLFTAAGAVLAVDAVRAAVRSGYPASAARRLSYVWGGAVTVAGAAALVMSIGEDLTAPAGAALGGPGLSVSLGSYNALGGAALLLTGLLLLAGTRLHRPGLARSGAAVGALSALTLYAQLGWVDSWLGGTNTSAAFFLSVALVGAATSGRLGHRSAKRQATAHA